MAADIKSGPAKDGIGSRWRLERQVGCGCRIDKREHAEASEYAF